MKSSSADGYADGGAIYARGAAWCGHNPSSLNVSNSTFANNKVNSAEYDARGGAVYIGSDSVREADSQMPANLRATIKDTSFVGNVSDSGSVSESIGGGGALWVNNATVDFVVTKDIVNYGNVASIQGVANESLGGFMYLNKSRDTETAPAANFNIASNASMIIGNGTAGQDSIASSDSSASINKTGAGTLTVNSSMEYFTGSLAVNQGDMNITGKVGASSLSVANNSVLRLTVANEPVLTNENLSFANAGTLVLISKSSESSGKVAASSNLNFGNVAVYGGTFDSESGVFTSGKSMEFGYDDYDHIIQFREAGTAKFSDDSSSLTIISQGAISFGKNVRDDSVAVDSFGEDLLGAWTVEGNIFDDTVVMSFVLLKSVLNAHPFNHNFCVTFSASYF